MHWPGANMLGMGAILLMAFMFLPIYFFTGIRNPETKVNTIVSSALIVIGCGLFMALIRAPRGNHMLKVRETAAYIRNQEILEMERNLFKGLKEDSAKALRFELTNTIDLLCEDIKADVLELSTGLRKIEADFEANNQYLDDGSFGYNPFLHIPSGQSKYEKLTAEINNYNSKAMLSSNFQMLLPTTSNFIEYVSKSENSMINTTGMLEQLTQIQMLAFQNALVLAK